MAKRKFTQLDGYEIRDMLDYANDHLKASRHLFAGDHTYFDSAGYLAHLGLELFLKAWHLYDYGYFTDSHSLLSLYESIKTRNPTVRLSSSFLDTLRMVDKFNALRYPTILDPIDIGSDDWKSIIALVKELTKKMPSECFAEFENCVDIWKGGRVVRRKKTNES